MSLRATALLRSPKIWVFTVFAAVLGLVLTLGYLGGVLDTDAPAGRIPILWVNTDTGAGTISAGKVLTEHIRTGTAAGAAHWITADDEPAARQMLAEGAGYAAVIVPPDFSSRLAGLTDPTGAPAPPTITVLTNPIAGPAATGTATGVAQTVLAQLSRALGANLTTHLPADSPAKTGAAQVALANPITVVTTPTAPAPAHTAGGMAAFYYTLVLILTGFLIAQLLHSGVDGILGFTPREFLHKRATHPPLPIGRVQTLLTKVVLMTGCAAIAATVIETVAVAGLGMPSSAPLGLWAFSVLAVATAGVLPLVLLAVFGAPGALLATVVLVVFGVPSSGGAYPPELLPAVFRRLGEVLPMRHVTDGVRDLVFTTPATGLTGSIAAVLGWLLVSLATGVALTHFYDHSGRLRASTHELSIPTVAA
ncbi:YhgE/Pip domain-containing protein [Nocardia sp. NPDC006044]|uniref:YhgE/Pip domain-containing protein n=1 Tax=Nocardia sp. NPDC006044 TaxID=3364306 RepID=UPI00368D88D3